MDQLRATPSRAGEVRCPYCHDLLESAGDELIECPGCGTQHHGACIAELGHCTVLGCAQPLTRAALPPLPVGPESPARRMVRERQRGRVQHFVRGREEARGEPRPCGQRQADRARAALRLGGLAVVAPGLVGALLLLLGEGTHWLVEEVGLDPGLGMALWVLGGALLGSLLLQAAWTHLRGAPTEPTRRADPVGLPADAPSGSNALPREG